MVRWLSREIPEESLVFLGNSLPVREWNLAATWEDRGFRCFSNRGANGIDGALSTFLGLGCDERECWAILGDLTTLYDLSAPWVLNQMRCRNVRIVVVNNGGGRIFSRLPALRAISNSQRQLMENDHRTSFEHWASMWGMAYVQVTEKSKLSLPDGPVVMEAVPDPVQNDLFWKKWEER